MRNKLKNILISFLSLGTLLMTLSCSTPWIFVNQSEVDKLLSSPEEIEFDNNKYILRVFYDEPIYSNASRGCPFNLCHSILIKDKGISFLFDKRLNSENNNKSFSSTFKVINFFIINKSTSYFFKTNVLNMSKGIDNLYGYSVIPPKDYNFNKDDISVIELESNKKIYFIKVKIQD